MKLTIDRQEWLHGEGSSTSCLLRTSDGKRCCVGIYARALGVKDELLRDVAWPRQNITNHWDAAEAPWLLPWNGVGGCNEFERQRLAVLNDAPKIANREADIKEIFARHDVDVTFIN